MMVGKDLMVGDWVRYKEVDEIPLKVNGTTSKVWLEHSLVWDKKLNKHERIDRYSKAEYDEICPIPLTNDILENYGFHRISGGAWDYFYIKGIEWFGLYRKEEGFALHIGQSEVYLNYVHELQHALRLCKIEKEIEL